jgi:hypothetical protein
MPCYTEAQMMMERGYSFLMGVICSWLVVAAFCIGFLWLTKEHSE